MKSIKKLFFFACFLLASYTSLLAQNSKVKTKPAKFLITGALELGGDEIAEVYFTNGERQGVRAGQGGSVGFGGQFQISGAEKFLLRSTVGIKYVTTAADNVHIRLTRIPIVLSGNYMATTKLRISAGLSMHRNIQFNTGGLGGDAKFKAASGPIFEIAYTGIGLSYTAMKYKDESNHSYSANAIGLTFSIALPRK
ncbi:MAG: hypothetical protein JWP69_1731 [Flaviaesturariibacter sp.]|nr:hypothetical protein [Flaviaesturariibacter sp.]